MSSEEDIGNLRYKIGRINIELSNLSKMLEKKKKLGVLGEEEEYDLEHSISAKKNEIKNLESEIRKIENMKVRGHNLSG